MNKPDFITGATGIVGRELVVQLINSGRSVIALRRENSDVNSIEKLIPANSPLKWVMGDLNNSESLEKAMLGCSRIFHTAAIVSFHPDDAKNIISNNAEGTANVVNAALHTGVKDFIHVSSVFALGHIEDELITENTPFEESDGVTDYARSKYKAELEVWRGQEEGLNVAVVNPTIIMGAGDFKRSSSELFSQIDAGIPLYPQGSNGYVSSADVAKACIILADNRVWGERFILNSENLKYKDLIRSVAQALNTKPPAKPIRPWMVGIVWRAFWLLEKLTGKRALATKDSLSMAQLNMSYNGTKIEKVLLQIDIKWVYEPVSIAIERTASAYLSASN
ncbi:MAG: nucleoside-diphosphate sugar epimerase [Bacteroidetes bacterium]|nr:MAG: nucleoside-diphosphate sugar epimerase [Bacteroidota bacterium]